MVQNFKFEPLIIGGDVIEEWRVYAMQCMQIKPCKKLRVLYENVNVKIDLQASYSTATAQFALN